MYAFAGSTIITVGTNIWRLIKFDTALGYVSITYLTANVIRTIFTSLEEASVYRGIFTDAVSKTFVLVDTVIFAFRSKTIDKAAVVAYLSGYGRS